MQAFAGQAILLKTCTAADRQARISRKLNLRS